MPSRVPFRAVLSCALALGLLGLSGVTAGAHTKRTASDHTMTFTKGDTSERFSGKIESSARACERGRTVKLFRVVAGPPADELIATNKSNRRGKWAEEQTGPAAFDAGKYYAMATKKVIKKKGHKHICKSSKSNLQTVVVTGDADGDGWPDDQDCAPEFPNPPGKTECYGPATAYDINEGAATGNVVVGDLQVTAVNFDEDTMWAQVPEGAPGYQGIDNSGLEIDLSAATTESPATGALVTVIGETTQDGVAAEEVEIVSLGTPLPEPLSIEPAALTTNPALDDVVVEIGPVKLESQSAAGWLTQDRTAIRFDAWDAAAPPNRSDRSWFASVVGLADTETVAILPRTDSDIADATAVNETGETVEADFCNIQFPTGEVITSVGASTSVWSRIYEAGITEPAGPSANVIAQVTFGILGTDPRTSESWHYEDAAFNTQIGNDDEYHAQITPTEAGNYNYAYRFSLDGGATFTYCDSNGAGSNNSFTFEPSDMGVLTVNP